MRSASWTRSERGYSLGRVIFPVSCKHSLFVSLKKSALGVHDSYSFLPTALFSTPPCIIATKLLAYIVPLPEPCRRGRGHDCQHRPHRQRWRRQGRCSWASDFRKQPSTGTTRKRPGAWRGVYSLREKERPRRLREKVVDDASRPHTSVSGAARTDLRRRPGSGDVRRSRARRWSAMGEDNGKVVLR